MVRCLKLILISVCFFIVINVLHEVSMSFLIILSVAFNFTTYHKQKLYDKFHL